MAEPANANQVINAKLQAEDLLDRCKGAERGWSFAEAGITANWHKTYAKITRRANGEQSLSTSFYHVQVGNNISAFIGGFSDNDDWLLRNKIENKQRIYDLIEHEVKYTNPTGYW